MRFVDEVIAACDQAVPAILASQVTDCADSRYGGFMSEQFHVDPRRCGFVLSELLSVYVTASSCHHKSEQVAQAMRAAFTYLERHQRPDGCFDLTSCNYASAPDTAFMINAVLLGWWLLDKQQDEELAWLCEPLLDTVDTSLCQHVRPQGYAPDLNCSDKRGGVLRIPSSNPPPTFEVQKGVFNQMP